MHVSQDYVGLKSRWWEISAALSGRECTRSCWASCVRGENSASFAFWWISDHIHRDGEPCQGCEVAVKAKTEVARLPRPGKNHRLPKTLSVWTRATFRVHPERVPSSLQLQREPATPQNSLYHGWEFRAVRMPRNRSD